LEQLGKDEYERQLIVNLNWIRFLQLANREVDALEVVTDIMQNKREKTLTQYERRLLIMIKATAESIF
jgi:hypothetical protein